VHLLQAEAERVTPDNLSAVLKELHHEKLTLRQRHVAVAKFVSDYDFNNTYQYIIAREDVHLSWLEAALAELGVTPDEVPEPALPARGKKDGFAPLVTEDAREAGELVARWRQRSGDITNARHSKMVNVMLGETLEQKRFFDQMIAGREDLLGRRSNGAGSPGTGDGVIAERWRE
jgi:Mn-containing catalase